MLNTSELLVEATRKLICLQSRIEWRGELLEKAPPVLWFGDSNSSKPKIVTLGANPSRWEFLDQPATKKKSLGSRVYLEEGKRRFYQLGPEEKYESILMPEIQEKVISSYNNYFKTGNSYKWFGKNVNNTYNVECVLRGMEASYFETPIRYQAVHIDLFPFATFSNFVAIQKQVELDLFNDGWAMRTVDALLGKFQPVAVLVFGRTNFDAFCKYGRIGQSSENRFSYKKENGKVCSCAYWTVKYNGSHVIGLSTNLGNPVGFNPSALNVLGMTLQQTI